MQITDAECQRTGVLLSRKSFSYFGIKWLPTFPWQRVCAVLQRATVWIETGNKINENKESCVVAAIYDFVLITELKFWKKIYGETQQRGWDSILSFSALSILACSEINNGTCSLCL